MKKIRLELSLEEVNLILQSLGEFPFKEVYELIGKINAQANQQLQNGTSEEAPINNPGKDE
jgi:hypothetical protein